MSEIKTRAGVIPDENGMPFSITTEAVEKYIQKKVDTVMQKAGKDSFSVRVITTEAGRNFLPFMVLPLYTTLIKMDVNLIKRN